MKLFGARASAAGTDLAPNGASFIYIFNSASMKSLSDLYFMESNQAGKRLQSAAHLVARIRTRIAPSLMKLRCSMRSHRTV
jgi:hypothetical protein